MTWGSAGGGYGAGSIWAQPRLGGPRSMRALVGCLAPDLGQEDVVHATSWEGAACRPYAWGRCGGVMICSSCSAVEMGHGTPPKVVSGVACPFCPAGILRWTSARRRCGLCVLQFGQRC
jgi:hypothetical protein